MWAKRWFVQATHRALLHVTHTIYICNYFWLTSGKGSPKFGSYCNSNSVEYELFLLCSPLNQQTCESWGWKYSFYLTFWKKNYSWILVSTLLLLFLFIHTRPLNLEINKKKTVTWINKENTFLGTIGFFFSQTVKCFRISHRQKV